MRKPPRPVSPAIEKRLYGLLKRRISMFSDQLGVTVTKRCHEPPPVGAFDPRVSNRSPVSKEVSCSARPI